MKLNYFFKNLTEKDKKTAENYLEKKIKKISKLISPEDQEISICHLTLEYHKKHNCYTLKIQLELPFGTLHAEDSSHEINKPLDIISDKLIVQLKKQKDKIRGEINTKERKHQSIKKIKKEQVLEVLEAKI